MTNALMRKAVKAIEEFREEHPCEYVHGCCFHHYGADYRIEESSPNIFKLFRCAKTDIYDALVAKIKL